MSLTSSDSSGDEETPEVDDGFTLANSRLLEGVPDLAVTCRIRMKTEVQKIVKIQELGSEERKRKTVKRNRIQSPSSEEDCFPELKQKQRILGKAKKAVKRKESSTAGSCSASRLSRLEVGEKIPAMASLLSPAPLLGNLGRRQAYKTSTVEKRRSMSSKIKNIGSVVKKTMVKDSKNTQEGVNEEATAFQADMPKGSRQEDLNNGLLSSTSNMPPSIPPIPPSSLPPVASSPPLILTPSQEKRLSSLLVQLMEKKIKESPSHSERELLRSAYHVMQCPGCEDSRLHGKGCGQCRGRGKESRRRGEGKANSRIKAKSSEEENKRKGDTTAGDDKKKADRMKTPAIDTVSEALVKVVREQARSFKTATVQKKNIFVSKGEAPHNNNAGGIGNMVLERVVNDDMSIQNQRPAPSSPPVPKKVCLLNNGVWDMTGPGAHVYSSPPMPEAEDEAMTDSDKLAPTSSPAPPLLEDGMWDELEENILRVQANYQAEREVDKDYEQLPSASLPNSQKKLLMVKEGVWEVPKSILSTSCARPENYPGHQDSTPSPASPKKVLVLKNGVWETSNGSGRPNCNSEQPALAPPAPPKKYVLRNGEWVWQNEPKLVDVQEDVDGLKGGYFSIR